MMKLGYIMQYKQLSEKHPLQNLKLEESSPSLFLFQIFI